MKKIIEIDDNLYEKLEKIQKDYSINSLTPVISLILNLGVNWFKKLEAITPQACQPPPTINWEWWTAPVWTYPMSGTIDCDNNTKVKWNLINAISGCINDER